MDYTIILALMGGLGLFLYGMKLMSDGLEKAAGAKLRRILEIFTTNRLTGMLVGIFFTGSFLKSIAHQFHPIKKEAKASHQSKYDSIVHTTVLLLNNNLT